MSLRLFPRRQDIRNSHQSYPSNPYHQVFDQLQWLSDFANDNSDLSFGNTPSIYYDSKLLYHERTPDGCRYKCLFPETYDTLDRGDAAVFSSQFPTTLVQELKRKRVLIALETAEAPPYATQLDKSQLASLDMSIDISSASPVPYLHSIFVRNFDPKQKFTEFQRSQMQARNNTFLLPPFHKKRTGLVAWFVPFTGPQRSTMRFVEAISNFLPVDIYGDGMLSIPKDRNPFEWISEKYKFYLAFEDTDCKEYITERAFYQALNHGMIPIVMGNHNPEYDNLMPPRSFIAMGYFKSIRKLTDYLHYLDKNDTAYASYFAWKKHGKILGLNRPDCRLCGFMHLHNAGRLTLPKFDPSNFYGSPTTCVNKQLPPLQ